MKGMYRDVQCFFPGLGMGAFWSLGMNTFKFINIKSLFLDEITRVTHASQMNPLVERAKTEGVERDRNSGHQPRKTRVEARGQDRIICNQESRSLIFLHPN